MRNTPDGTLGGEEIVAIVSDELVELVRDPRAAAIGLLEPEAVIAGVATTLSRLRHGTWMALLMNSDPGTSRVVVVDDAHREMASFVNRYIASIHHPGVAPTTGLSQRVIESGTPLVISALSLDEFVPMNSQAFDEYLSGHALPIAVDKVSLAIVPMRARSGIIGVLGLFDWNPTSELTSQDAAWMAKVADRVGLAVELTALHRRAQVRLERLNSLASMAHTIGYQDLRQTLTVIAERLVAPLEVDAVDVLILSEDESALVVAASAGFRGGPVPGYRIPVPRDLIESGGLSLANPTHGQLSGDSKRRSLFAREGFSAYQSTPLRGRHGLRGLLEVFKRGPIEPDQEWLAFLELAGRCAAVAIENASLTEAHRRQSATRPQSLAPAPDLSPRERQILGLIVDGSTNREIAAKLHVTPNTVKFHVRQLFEKVGASNRTELATTANRRGWN